MRTPLIIGATGAAAAFGALTAYRYVVRPWYETWGVDPAEGVRLLPGDELISGPTGGETRGITIAAPAGAIWPWLVQMGYGRGGWYSYDALDMRGSSADRIHPEWQSIAVGDIMKTYPGGGFEVVQIEPEHTIVLYLDDAIVERQRRAVAEAGPGADATPAGLAVSSAILGTQPAKFRATWSFVLEPIDGETTRLIERARVEYPEIDLGGRLTGPLVGFGVFVMMRRQMLGLKQRAERLVAEAPTTRWEAEPLVPVGHQELLPT